MTAIWSAARAQRATGRFAWSRDWREGRHGGRREAARGEGMRERRVMRSDSTSPRGKEKVRRREQVREYERRVTAIETETEGQKQ